jgi:predicted YcjX-like family ATPase
MVNFFFLIMDINSSSISKNDIHSQMLFPLFQVIRCFDFGQSQTVSSLTKFIEKIVIFSTQDKFIIKIYLIINLIKLIW